MLYTKDKCFFCNSHLNSSKEEPFSAYCGYCHYDYKVIEYDPHPENNYDILFKIDDVSFTYVYDHNGEKQLFVNEDGQTYHLDYHFLADTDNYKQVVERVKNLQILK